MVVTQLIGGLGNQLFQYALGRALADKHRTSLRLDTLGLKKGGLRTYALRHFAIDGEELGDDARKELAISEKPAGAVLRLAMRIQGRKKIPVICEKSFSFDPSVLEAPSTCYLQGYWQSPKYFSAIESQIRQQFTLRAPLSGYNLKIAERLAVRTAVSLHIRRGDYVSNAHTNSYHGVCDPEYYRAADAILNRMIGEFHLFVFSDDPNWAEANMKFASPVTILRHNGAERDYEDLRLMTLCRHHIIANSTFSWWGAWLCSNPDKIVIAPRQWFKDADHGTDDLIPASWIRI